MTAVFLHEEFVRFMVDFETELLGCSLLSFLLTFKLARIKTCVLLERKSSEHVYI
jgi:hypothetical protein